ncbi:MULTISPECIES: 2-oxoglutarate dehydrogenase E1 component [unclassified Imperialibacter]|uniref:2-oxoglutarate dehydrogenase E1 component n=1 Tax=unclassified Imperialibacter TaxID=2629706 RepID=UPI001251E849|nr:MULTISPECIES: 2-oxoglutarate dehydrogenase E1 component [unclassified Imperialibacter]CAD5246684.1 2-oxoglutarate decarboxylase, thiamin-requiring [Imperialibacter sp. 75]CAD5246745.1 2-oxoglutarate decarboxylase, thiamin-requiring [Imperialibacter sp. 89]VVS96426.1 2-oxoglutarate decarboxylase, thiamin-requiring [Imperialibacter sp. EC-SDR9]
MDKYSYIANAHSSYIDELYQSYKQDPESVDITWQKFFEGFEFSQSKYGENGQAATTSGGVSDKEIAVSNLIHAYRTRGHLKSKTNPVRERKDRKALLDLSDFGLSEADLDVEFQSGATIGIGKATLRKIVESLKQIYEGAVGFEYMYIREPDILEWYKKKVEFDALNFNPSIDEKKRILRKLNEAVVFENFLHTKYVGQKRFSLEGGETTIAALDAIINKGAELGVQEVMIGMAHRGRLNVLANIMGKTYEQIFNEFEGNAATDQTMGDGDVKYHMGYSSQIVTPSGNTVDLRLAPNPSHLEAVDPLVEGFLRAKVDREFKNDATKVLPILIHGDAAVAGQGIVYEVVQMSKLDGYTTGGTIHFVINNQVGFTTDFDDARSSIYCTDVAKVIDSPVLHVNGDQPEAVIFCVNLAVEFRQKFQRDVFIDMVCYRRHGHNESDEPKFTQPSLYNIISKHPNPREVYNKHLIERGDVDAQLADKMDSEFRDLLQDRLNMVKQKPLPYQYSPMEKEWQELRISKPDDFENPPKTSVDQKVIDKVGKALTTIPKGFKPLKQIDKVLKQRTEMIFEEKSVNWATAELLAYGSLLLEKKIVRMTGQDVQRGTFSHRHSVLRDSVTNKPHNSLDHIEEGQEKFRIFNSLLSEFGVLGFEFGYAMANPNALVIWEAQFGDFANGAQVMTDQFIVPSYTKWQRMNGLVLLLPHGYEGQGPEHSNARPERFLQMCSGNNMFFCNLTTPANFFHMLRRQLVMPFRMPAVLMSPKSLFRHPLVMSPISDLTEGGFQEVIGDTEVKAKDVKKLILCTGKIYFDLLDERQKSNRKDVALVRVEQLHPFPRKKILAEINKYKGAKLVWAQEEPENMGAWTFLLRMFPEVRMELVSRKAAASPATGYYKLHNKEQEEIVQKAFA